MAAAVAMRATKLPLTMSENDFKAIVIARAKQCDWMVMHTRPAQTKEGWRTPLEGHAGFPDLVLARRGVVLIRELKRHGEKPRPNQRNWLAALGNNGAVWSPLNWPEIIEELR